MKIGVITSRYAISGVPLAQMRFSRALASRGHSVDYLIGAVNEGCSAPVVENVNVVNFNKLRTVFMLFPIIRYLKKQKPDIIFSAGDHLNIIVIIAALIARSKVKISGSSRVTPYDTYSNKLFSKRWILKQLARIFMFRADVLTCVSEDMVKQYHTVFKNPRHVCVYNIIHDSQAIEKMLEPIEDETFQNSKVSIIVAAGMLESWKGFADLIKAMKIVKESSDAKLVIFGEGSLRQELESLITELNLEESVFLPGHVANPLKYFRSADVFVLSSYVEGMPNVLIEAMMCGCTPVSTNCPTGPSEILKDNKYGYLVPVKDSKAMAKAIQNAITKPINKSLLEEAIRPFSEDEVIKKHFELLGV